MENNADITLFAFSPGHWFYTPNEIEPGRERENDGVEICFDTLPFSIGGGLEAYARSCLYAHSHRIRYVVITNLAPWSPDCAYSGA